MIGNIIGMTGLIVSVLVFVLFVIGLIYSKIYSFKPGVYFFLLLIVHKVYSFVTPPLTRNYIDSFDNYEPILGLTIVELVAFLSLFPKIILFVAFLILIVGLRNFRNTKHLQNNTF